MADSSAQPKQTPYFNQGLVEDVLYPFREYKQIQDFISRNIVASFTITLLGLLLAVLGISPGIGAAIGGVGFAPTALEIIMRIIFNERNVLQRTTAGIAGLSVLISVLAGFTIYLLLGPGSLANLSASLLQFGVGLAITWIAGISAQMTMTRLQIEGVSLRIRTFVTVAVTTSIILFFVFIFPSLLSLVGLLNASDAITAAPAQAKLTFS